jgi:hypothetical protein
MLAFRAPIFVKLTHAQQHPVQIAFADLHQLTE